LRHNSLRSHSISLLDPRDLIESQNSIGLSFVSPVKNKESFPQGEGRQPQGSIGPEATNRAGYPEGPTIHHLFEKKRLCGKGIVHEPRT